MGVTYLLDTHAFYWLAREPHRVTAEVVTELNESAGVLVSDVSAFEVSTKVRLGKFDRAASLTHSWAESVQQFGARSLPVGTRHALLAGGLEWDHRDPFDRLLAAQAIVEGARLVTADAVFGGAPGLSVLPC